MLVFYTFSIQVVGTFKGSVGRVRMSIITAKINIMRYNGFINKQFPAL